MMKKQQGQFWQILMILTALTIFGSAVQSISAQMDAPDEQNRIRQQTKLTANDGTFDDNFGWVVAVAGDTAVIGAPNDDNGANTNQGSAYVFVRTAGVWTFLQKLTASDGATGDLFGHSVAVANASAPAQTVIMVGAVGDDIGANPNQGSVYVFVNNSTGGTFNFQGKLTASGGVANDSFGASVAMTGSFTVIGANGVDLTHTDQGAAYIFVRNGTVWEEEQKLTTQSAVANENMGWDVDISGTSVIIGTNQQVASFGGAGYIFTRSTGGNTWLQQLNLASTEQKFGTSVAISGDTAVFGSLAASINGNASQGRASVYRRTGTSWSSVGSLSASDGAAGDEFGRSVAVSENTIVVGAHFDSLGGNTFQGSAYVFTRSGNGWAQRQKLLDSTGAIGDSFGNSVAISGATVLVGAWKDDVGPLGQAGSVSVFLIKAPFDFDGDGKSDVSVFRPSNGAWYVNGSTSGFFGVTFGLGTDLTAPADYDGDGKTDVAVFRPTDGGWYRLNSSNNTFVGAIFGQNGDLPRPGDFDGDGKADINVFRPSNGGWYRLNSSNNSFVGALFGQNGDKPLIADFDGDDKSDLAVFRPSAGAFYSLDSSNGAFRATAFGFGTDIPTPGDFDGDGKADVAVFRPSNGSWYRFNSSNGSFVGLAFGQNGDVPVAADYDGDGKSDIAVFRNGNWYYLNSSNGAFVGLTFGLGTDKPIPAAFNQ